MDAWLIVGLGIAALVAVGLVLAAKKPRDKRRDNERDVDAAPERLRAERSEAERHRARSELADELARVRADRDQLAAELHAARARIAELELKK